MSEFVDGIAVCLLAALIFVFGIFIGNYVLRNDISDACKNYGQYVTSEYKLTCMKK